MAKRFSLTPDRVVGLVSLEWDDYTDLVPRRSQRWAASDRGWLHGHLLRSSLWATLGHYLDYEHCESYKGREDTVHAVSCVTRRAAWFCTVLEARAWIEAEAQGSELRHVVGDLISHGELSYAQAETFGAQS